MRVSVCVCVCAVYVYVGWEWETAPASLEQLPHRRLPASFIPFLSGYYIYYTAFLISTPFLHRLQLEARHRARNSHSWCGGEQLGRRLLF